MYAVVIRFTITDRSALTTDLDELVRDVSAAPGFVAVYGVTLEEEEDQGIAIVVFDSKESASFDAIATRVMERTALTVRTAEVGEVVAHA